MEHKTTEATPFADLPAALVEEVLRRTTPIAESLLASFGSIRERRTELRRSLTNSGMLVTDASLEWPPAPTTCATDGSYAIERLLTTDLTAAAAVAVEGLTPPSEKRHWELPHHMIFIAAEPHLEDTATILRALMLGEELELAVGAPHDIVMLDGTLTLPIIYFNQALNQAPETTALECSGRFIEKCIDYLASYLTILRSERSDKQYAALPKYSTRREIGSALHWPASYDDRGVLTLLLSAGELTRPVAMEQPRSQEGNVGWHLNTERLPSHLRGRAAELAEEIVAALQGVRVFYYKPHEWLPALRVELAASAASNSYRLSAVVQGLKHQCVTPSMLEPYPIYLADRTARALARAIPAFRQVTTQQVSEKYGGDIGEVFFAMHGYRSQRGR